MIVEMHGGKMGYLEEKEANLTLPAKINRENSISDSFQRMAAGTKEVRTAAFNGNNINSSRQSVTKTKITGGIFYIELPVHRLDSDTASFQERLARNNKFVVPTLLNEVVPENDSNSGSIPGDSLVLGTNSNINQGLQQLNNSNNNQSPLFSDATVFATSNDTGLSNSHQTGILYANISNLPKLESVGHSMDSRPYSNKTSDPIPIPWK